ncbi:alpha/beta hydrolase family protein [Pseudarthrobacter sp. NamE5]|uniref:alpha/beta hydrolase n=1 Tax=Pseudarthrobacter sp. NamE5 TaxID=2576839 RepID=UPI00110B07C4|nr:alpha/beta hydrolase-fold protein [Pseudarthrobacter sp. NamE5]TLM85133.1 esterase [Pseudarthrobacter sp. NamE5]
MEWFFDIRLIDGPLYWLVSILGLAGAAYLLWPPGPLAGRQWVVRVIAALAAAFALVASIHWALINILSLFPDNVPDTVLLWIVLAVAALILLVLRIPRTRWGSRTTGLAAVLMVAALSAVQVNAYFGLNRTVSDLLGTDLARIPTLEAELQRQPGESDGVPLQGWSAHGTVPDEGVLRKSAIPGKVSGMKTREAYIYLPPAYFADNRPALPVLVLVAGQPGGPADWLTGGTLQAHMDAYARSHGGVAPVVVVPDPNGSQSANTMCMDSRIARADTYLSQDVASWIKSTLSVETDHNRWAAGGFSFGGTCALQLATRHPQLFPAVLSFSGEAEPAIAKEREKTIEASFPGDPEAFNRQTPLAIMKERRFEGSGMYLTAGQDDPEFVAYLRTLAKAGKEAGFTVRAYEVEHTGHSWDTSSKRIADALDFLAERWGIAG